jgi:hypothetical protein
VKNIAFKLAIVTFCLILFKSLARIDLCGNGLVSVIDGTVEDVSLRCDARSHFLKLPLRFDAPEMLCAVLFECVSSLLWTDGVSTAIGKIRSKNNFTRLFKKTTILKKLAVIVEQLFGTGIFQNTDWYFKNLMLLCFTCSAVDQFDNTKVIADFLNYLYILTFYQTYVVISVVVAQNTGAII